tara:strand:+ start:1979 stop:4258 length:2280 start_codon:yes stop_codon:yes gene_type:complete
MNNSIIETVDDEIERYNRAQRLAEFAPPLELIKNKTVAYNKQTGANEILLPMQGGGYVKVGEMPKEEQPPAEADAPTNMQNELPVLEGFGDKPVKEFTKSLVRGGLVKPAKFLEEYGIYNPLRLQILNPNTGELDLDFKILSQEELEKQRAANQGKPFYFDIEELVKEDEEAGIVAGLAGGLGQFLGAYVGLAKFFKFGQTLLAQGFTRGAAADFLAFEGNEGRLTDILVDLGVDEKFIPSFLVTDPNDPDYVGRFKTAFEGGGLGIVAEGVTRGVGKLFRAIKDRDVPAEEVQQITKDGQKSIKQIIVDRLNQRGDMPTVGSMGGNVFASGNASATDRPGRISTRFPTAVNATENPLTDNLNIGLEEIKQSPQLYEYNVNITKDYPNMLAVADETVDETADRFIDHVKDNLLYLHDLVPAATRPRSQLWYDGARKITDDWTAKYNVPDSSVAGALAALSPQKDWYQNVSLAERTLEVTQNQKDFVMSKEMNNLFLNLKDQKGKPVFNKPAYKPLHAALKGKKYSEISHPDPKVELTLKAMFVRLYDQTYNTSDYKIVSPEGNFLETATNQDGSNSKAAWGSLNEISKAIKAIEANGDVDIISQAMGERHKVRNFYNNIYDPNNSNGDVTIDTHAVAAGLLRPLSGNSLEVDHNFKNQTIKGRGTTKGSSITGINGNYALYVEAYRRAAAERGILPRQMQSITWEAVRGLFTDTFKANDANVSDVDAIWSRYKNGEIELDETRRLVNERAGGYKPPSWE